MLTFDGVWHVGEVFSSRMNPGCHCSGQMADSVWVSSLLMSTLWSGPWWRWGYSTGRCMYGQRTQVLFIEGNVNAQRYCDEILRPITSCCCMIMNGPMLQGSVHNPWKLKTSQFLQGQPTHRTRHPLDTIRIRQRVPVPANIQQLGTATEEEWTNIQQATNLISSM